MMIVSRSRGNCGRSRPRPRRLLCQDLRDHRVRRRRTEDRVAGRKLIERRAQTIKVGAVIDRVLERLAPARDSYIAACPSTPRAP